MSEHTEVEVLLPLARKPTQLEQRGLIRQAFEQASDLIAPGRVVGLVSVGAAVHKDSGSPALKVRFAVEAPESVQPHRRSFATG